MTEAAGTHGRRGQIARAHTAEVLDASRAGRREGGGTIRGALACQVLLFLACLASAPAAAATPTTTLKVTSIAIPGFPGTGYILGAGAEVVVQMTIGGSEYAGAPSPLTQASFYIPPGVVLTTAGFADCAPSLLERIGVTACPMGSRAGPVGEGLGVVSFGNERVEEKVSIQGFFSASGGLTFYTQGTTPAAFEFLEAGHWAAASTPYGRKFVVDVPLVETVPGAPDASVTSFRVLVGAAYKRGKKTISYITLPKRCPSRGFLLKAELKFLSGEVVPATYDQPCPRRR
jgi:hypothetical protein